VFNCSKFLGKYKFREVNKVIEFCLEDKIYFFLLIFSLQLSDDVLFWIVYSHLEVKLLKQTWFSLLATLGACLLDTSQQQQWDSLLSNLTSLTSDHSGGHSTFGLPSWQDHGVDVRNCLDQMQQFLTQHATASFTTSVCGQHTVAEVIAMTFKVTQEAVEGQRSQWVTTGAGLVQTGMVLLHLLAPKGPVDPVQRACIKLEHLRQEVSLFTFIQLSVPVVYAYDTVRPSCKQPALSNFPYRVLTKWSY
jgi:hypothetical protein